MRLLRVEDDAMIGRAVRQGLGDAGLTVDWVADSGREVTVLFPPP